MSDDEVGVVLELQDEVMCFVAVALGFAVSLVAATWLLSYVEVMLVSGMGFTPFSLLGLVGHVVRQRALRDWHQQRSRPVVVRLVRAFFIGLVWPLWLKR